MCNNCMHGGCSGCSGHAGGHCGNQCFSVGPFRATSSVCPPVNKGSIIPFSSGLIPAVLATLVNGLAGTVSAVGFGSTITGVTLVNNTITLPILPAGSTEAFTVPRAGTISSLAATFTELAGITILGSATVRAEIYRAPAGSNTFTATGVGVNLSPQLTGVISVGTILQGATDANFPVVTGDRLVMVFSVSGTGITAVTTVTGSANAGITIS